MTYINDQIEKFLTRLKAEQEGQQRAGAIERLKKVYEYLESKHQRFIKNQIKEVEYFFDGSMKRESILSEGTLYEYIKALRNTVVKDANRREVDYIYNDLYDASEAKKQEMFISTQELRWMALALTNAAVELVHHPEEISHD